MTKIEQKLIEYALDSENAKINYELALEYDNLNQIASAISHYIRCAERTDEPLLAYECLLRGGIATKRQGMRIHTEKSFFQNAVNICPERPEAYSFLAEVLTEKGDHHHAYTYICIGVNCAKNEHPNLLNPIKNYGGLIELKIKKLIYAKKCGIEDIDNDISFLNNLIKHVK